LPCGSILGRVLNERRLIQVPARAVVVQCSAKRRGSLHGERLELS
jgi:hypothetical protein